MANSTPSQYSTIYKFSVGIFWEVAGSDEMDGEFLGMFRLISLGASIETQDWQAFRDPQSVASYNLLQSALGNSGATIFPTYNSSDAFMPKPIPEVNFTDNRVTSTEQPEYKSPSLYSGTYKPIGKPLGSDLNKSIQDYNKKYKKLKFS